MNMQSIRWELIKDTLENAIHKKSSGLLYPALIPVLSHSHDTFQLKTIWK